MDEGLFILPYGQAGETSKLLDDKSRLTRQVQGESKKNAP